MRLLAYARVSTEEQAQQGHSLGQQRERVQAYCALHGHQLIDVVVDEGVSASVALGKRRGGAALVQRLRAGEVNGVVVVRLDRLFRVALDGLRFFADVAERHDLAVHSVSELIDTSTPAGRLALTIQLAAAQYERDLAAQRATECNTALREQGRVYGGIPYGCTKRAGRLLRAPATWAQREAIVTLRESGLSLRQIAERLHAQRIPSPAGARRWSLSTLQNLLSTHGSLRHLAMDGQAAGSAANPPDTEVSLVDCSRLH